MNKKELRNYSETLVEITLAVGMKYGHMRAYIHDSMELNDFCIRNAEEFEKLHKKTDWEEVDWIETVETFADKKIEEVLSGKHPWYTKE